MEQEAQRDVDGEGEQVIHPVAGTKGDKPAQQLHLREQADIQQVNLQAVPPQQAEKPLEELDDILDILEA